MERRAAFDQLAPGDVALLTRVAPTAGIHPDHRGMDSASMAARLRRSSDELDTLLGASETFDAVFGPKNGRDEPLLHASPFLVFAVAVNRARDELGRLRYVEEWVGPRQRIPVFAATELRAFLDQPMLRDFLAELLTSYTHVASGAVYTRSPRGLRRQRFSELDLRRLASLLEATPAEAHAGVYRRLGDLALFLVGVFPDHTARRMFAPIDVARLARSLPETNTQLIDDLAARGGVGLLEHLGAGWYRQAARASEGQGSLLRQLAERFSDARRVLNHVTDRYLFPFRADWFPGAA